MISKGITIFTIGIIGIIFTLILWLISIFRIPNDIKTYFIYDDSDDIKMINKNIRAKEKIYIKKVNNLTIDEAKFDNEYFDSNESKIDIKNLDLDETKMESEYLELDETKIDDNYLYVDETEIDSRFNDIN